MIMSKGKVLICDRVHECLIEGLKGLGYEVDYQPEVILDEVAKQINDLTGIVINSRTVLIKELLDHADKLRFIARLGSGMEIVDVPFATSKGIVCISAPEGNARSVAEQALAAMLSWMNNLVVADRYLRSGQWERERFRGRTCAETQLGIIGYGHTGRALAESASSLGIRVLAYDKYHNDFSDGFAISSSLPELLATSHVVSLHLPLTEETIGYLNADFFAQIKRGTMLMNTSRGAMMHLDDTLKALDERHIDFLYCDVLPHEGKSFLEAVNDERFNRFIKHPRVAVSPHVAGWTRESFVKLSEVLLSKIHEAT